MQTYILIAAAAFACGLIIVILRNPRIFKKLIGGMAAGFAALAAVNLTASFTGIGLAVSFWTIGVAAVLGIPGVVSMIVLKIFWHI